MEMLKGPQPKGKKRKDGDGKKADAAAKAEADQEGKKARHGLKPLSDMDRQERKAAWGRLNTAIAKDDVPKAVKDKYEQIMAMTSEERAGKQDMQNRFWGNWIEGVIMKDRGNECKREL